MVRLTDASDFVGERVFIGGSRDHDGVLVSDNNISGIGFVEPIISGGDRILHVYHQVDRQTNYPGRVDGLPTFSSRGLDAENSLEIVRADNMRYVLYLGKLRKAGFEFGF